MRAYNSINLTSVLLSDCFIHDNFRLWYTTSSKYLHHKDLNLYPLISFYLTLFQVWDLPKGGFITYLELILQLENIKQLWRKKTTNSIRRKYLTTITGQGWAPTLSEGSSQTARFYFLLYFPLVVSLWSLSSFIRGCRKVWIK